MAEVSGKEEKGLLWGTCDESKLILKLQMNKSSMNAFIFKQRNKSYLKLNLQLGRQLNSTNETEVGRNLQSCRHW